MKKNSIMYELYGYGDGLCSSCKHLVRFEHGHVFYKCKAYGISNSAATDWRLKYNACGLKNKDLKGINPAYKEKAKDEPMEGQVNLLDLMGK